MNIYLLWTIYVFVGIIFTEFLCDQVRKKHGIEASVLGKLTVFTIYPLFLCQITFWFLWYIFVYIFTGKLPNK